MIATVPRLDSAFSDPDEVMMVFFYFVPYHVGHPVELSPFFTREGETCSVDLQLPGVDPDDIDIHYRDRQVFISAEVSEEGHFYAAMTLPQDCTREEIEAVLQGDTLRLTLHQNDSYSESERVIVV